MRLLSFVQPGVTLAEQIVLPPSWYPSGRMMLQLIPLGGLGVSAKLVIAKLTSSPAVPENVK